MVYVYIFQRFLTFVLYNYTLQLQVPFFVSKIGTYGKSDRFRTKKNGTSSGQIKVLRPQYRLLHAVWGLGVTERVARNAD